MKTYEVEIVLKVSVSAYDESDAKEIVDDTFGPGEDCGVFIANTNIRSIKEQ